MKVEIKIILATLIGFISFFIFNALEYDVLLFGFSKYIQSAIFSSTITALIIKSDLRYYFFLGSSILLAGMVLFYLFNFLPLSNFLGSIGIGILTISSLFYLKELIRNSGNNWVDLFFGKIRGNTTQIFVKNFQSEIFIQ